MHISLLSFVRLPGIRIIMTCYDHFFLISQQYGIRMPRLLISCLIDLFEYMGYLFRRQLNVRDP